VYFVHRDKKVVGDNFVVFRAPASTRSSNIPQGAGWNGQL
jgi:hypothetical protein